MLRFILVQTKDILLHVFMLANGLSFVMVLLLFIAVRDQKKIRRNWKEIRLYPKSLHCWIAKPHHLHYFNRKSAFDTIRMKSPILFRATFVIIIKIIKEATKKERWNKRNKKHILSHTCWPWMVCFCLVQRQFRIKHFLVSRI